MPFATARVRKQIQDYSLDVIKPLIRNGNMSNILGRSWNENVLSIWITQQARAALGSNAGAVNKTCSYFANRRMEQFGEARVTVKKPTDNQLNNPQFLTAIRLP
jgi:hypothetical protein